MCLGAFVDLKYIHVIRTYIYTNIHLYNSHMLPTKLHAGTFYICISARDRTDGRLWTAESSSIERLNELLGKDKRDV